MIDFYTAATPNGWKISVLLEELGLPYKVIPIDFEKKEQKSPAFLKINPNGRIPAIVDRANGEFAVFESGAIMIYLAKKAGKLLPRDEQGESRVIQWLMFQMGGVGPMMGQANVFFRYFPEKIQPAIDRYQNEGRRLFEVLNTQLAGREYLCDEYSIADIANWSWVRSYKWSGINVEGLDHLLSWVERLEARPACQRGLKVPQPIDFEKIRQTAQSMVQR